MLIHLASFKLSIDLLAMLNTLSLTLTLRNRLFTSRLCNSLAIGIVIGL